MDTANLHYNLIFRPEPEGGFNDVLCWSREAKELKRAGKLPVLRSLRDLR
jgi:hypothetical protein